MINMALLLASLALVESNNNPNAVGKLGEVSEYQLRSFVWTQNRQSRFCKPTNPECSFFAAAHHLHRITTEIRTIKGGKEPTLPEIACAWNYGIANCKKHGFKFGKYPKCVRDYAWSVSSIYQDHFGVEAKRTELTAGCVKQSELTAEDSCPHSHSRPKPKTRKKK